MSSKAALGLAGGVMVVAFLLASACGGGEEDRRAAPATPELVTVTPESTAPVSEETPESAVGRSLGVGVYPTTIDFGETLRGGEYFRSIGVMNPGDSEQTFALKIGGEAAPWLSLVNPEDRTQAVDAIAVPARDEARVYLRLLVQPEVPNGVYSGFVQAVSEAGGAAGDGAAGSGVNVGSEMEVSLEVTGTQSITGSLVDVATRDVEVGSPLRIRTTVQNSGNVQVNPQIRLEVVDPNGSVVGQASFDGEVVYPNETQTLVSEWDSTGQQVGERIARVGVNFGDLDLGSKEVPFNILAVGALTRQGMLEGLTLENAPYAGVMAKIAAHFRNTGEIDTRAIFLGELYYNSVLTDTISTPERLVEPGEDVAIEVFVDVPHAGTYTVRGKVNFEGKETEEKELTFDVQLPGGGGDDGLSIWAWVLIGAGTLAGIAVVVGGSWVLARRLLRLVHM